VLFLLHHGGLLIVKMRLSLPRRDRNLMNFMEIVLDGLQIPVLLNPSLALNPVWQHNL
jgi:hypothetical protein